MKKISQAFLKIKKKNSPLISNIIYGKSLQIIMLVFTLILCGIVLSFKLTNSSLWYDESIEFFYSKYMLGPVPGGRLTFSMYQRIRSTYQPPLYNILMYFWLKMNDSEYWFRLAGVFITLISSIGVYFTVKRKANYYWATVSIILYSFTFMIYFYAQECAEYNLAMCFLAWTCYFFVRLLDDTELRLINLILYVLFCVFSVYSQYGTVFIVLGMTLAVTYHILKTKNKKNIAQTFGVYLLAIIFAAIPLIKLFLLPQMKSQGSIKGLSGTDITNNFFYDYILNLYVTFRYLFHYESFLKIAMIFSVGIICLVFIFSKNYISKQLIITNILSFSLYYLMVKFGYYANTSYGSGFGNRWALFLLPVWIISFIIILYDFLSSLLEFVSNLYGNKKNKKIVLKSLKIVFSFSLLCLSTFYVFTNYKYIKMNWEKDDIRAVANAWYENEGYNKETLVHEWSDSGFQFYLTHNLDYKSDFQDSIKTTGVYIRTVNENECYNKILAAYNGKLPKELYIVGPNGANMNTLETTFLNANYHIDVIYNEGLSKLIYVSFLNE